MASRVLSNLGVGADAVREQVILLLAGEASRSASLAGEGRDVGPAGSAERRLLFRGRGAGVRGGDPLRGARRDGRASDPAEGVGGAGVLVHGAEQTETSSSAPWTQATCANASFGTLREEEFVLLEAGLVRAGEDVLEGSPR